MNQLDSITVEVIRNNLISAAREMNRNLIRTAYDTIIYEIFDFGLGLYDRKCRLIAEAPGLPAFIGANDYGLRKILEYLGEENMHPGDLILSNWPYWSGNHVLDVLAVSPIFVGDTLVGYTAIKEHWLDLGQKDPGYVLDSTDVYQEGVIFPCTKIYKEGVLDRQIADIIRFCSRMPDRVMGNMNSQISACRTGERRVKALVAKFGLEVFEAAVGQILDHGERLARQRLAKLPRGTWSAEDYIDDDGVDKSRMVKIKATVSISDAEMTVDFTGSDAQTPGPINLPLGCTTSAAKLVFKAVTTPDTPANDGDFRPLRVISPPGCVMHAVPPAATFTLWTGILATEVVLKALAQAMPDQVPACSGGDLCSMMGVGIHPRTGRWWLEATNEGVGFGAHAGADGENVIMHMTESSTRNNPIEVLETKSPMRIEKLEIRQDSAGAGLHRGGLGLTRDYRYLAECSALTLVKKTKTRPWAINGGQEGENCHVILYPGTKREQVTGMVYQHMEPGELLRNCSGGGGGWGNPLKRDPDKVLRDVIDEYVSVRAAREVYGVVIDMENQKVDEAATHKLRDELAAQVAPLV